MGSELAEASMETLLPTTTVWFAPGLATGGKFAVLAKIETAASSLLAFPSLTTRVATYVPDRSALKVGFAEVAAVSVATLLAGLDCRTHL